jgi:hypothetical protein
MSPLSQGDLDCGGMTPLFEGALDCGGMTPLFEGATCRADQSADMSAHSNVTSAPELFPVQPARASYRVQP